MLLFHVVGLRWYVAIAMHCNLRPPDAAPVVLRYNYYTTPIYQRWSRSRSTHPFPTYKVFTADAVYYAVTLTLTFDLERLYVLDVT